MHLPTRRTELPISTETLGLLIPIPFLSWNFHVKKSHTPGLGGPTREAQFLSSLVVPSFHPSPLFLDPTYSPKLSSMPDSKA